jgi:hypothetical protein
MTSDLERQLAALIEPMNIPKLRRDVTQLANIMWLSRNMFVQNSQHPNFQQADAILKALLCEKGQ